uniref:Uncharacterized protein n=1 Tax=Timema shepardi TaxID=629360 RepID=A0A7R9B028_TIMSH|nr:unnamed protein product [Timema shepardi]
MGGWIHMSNDVAISKLARDFLMDACAQRQEGDNTGGEGEETGKVCRGEGDERIRRRGGVVGEAVVYMFTDIHIPDRLSHANRCYMTFWERTKALQKWINQTIETSLSKDLADVNQKMGEVNIKLRRIRVGLVRNQMDEEDVEAYEAAARKQSHASLFIDSVEGEESSILPPGGHHLDHDRLFRSSQNIVAPRALRNNKDQSGDKLQMQLKKRLGSNRSQVWSRQNLDEMHLSYMRSQQ